MHLKSLGVKEQIPTCIKAYDATTTATFLAFYYNFKGNALLLCSIVFACTGVKKAKK